MARKVATRKIVGATGLSRLPAGSANLGFTPALRLRAGSRTRVLILSQTSGRQDSNSEVGYDHQELATRDSQGDSQSASAPVDPELKRVIDAWQKLPIGLRGAIMAIVDLNCPGI